MKKHIFIGALIVIATVLGLAVEGGLTFHPGWVMERGIVLVEHARVAKGFLTFAYLEISAIMFALIPVYFFMKSQE